MKSLNIGYILKRSKIRYYHKYVKKSDLNQKKGRFKKSKV